MLVGQVSGNNTLIWMYGADNGKIGFTYNGTEYYYIRNVQGDVVAIADSSGNIVVVYEYNEWGEVFSITGSLADTIGQINPIRYRGYYYDTETGLYYLISRYYDAEIGRFINTDSIVTDAQGLIGLNLFAYCGNNPVNRSDPSGMFWKEIGNWFKKVGETIEEFLTPSNVYSSTVGGTTITATALASSLESTIKSSPRPNNIGVSLERTDINVLLQQATGEYEEKLGAKGLELVVDECPENPMIIADGKLLWRVFDNLMNNIYKYAQSGTRVYINSQTDSDKVSVVFKNISGTQLNIPGDELMERFVRGDVSRNTEGSGLGLSIAKSLIELQNGEFEIEIDGDLFKATVKLPKAD